MSTSSNTDTGKTRKPMKKKMSTGHRNISAAKQRKTGGHEEDVISQMEVKNSMHGSTFTCNSIKE